MCPTGGRKRALPEPARFIEIPAGMYEIGITGAFLSGVARAAGGEDLPAAYIATAVPHRTVRLERVRLSRFLVTAADFEEFVGSTGFITEAEREGWGWTWEGGWTKREGLSWRCPFGGDVDRDYWSGRDFMPALQVSWNDADAWCRWMSGETGESIRLPSEAEWEAFGLLSGVRSISEIPSGETRIAVDTAGDFFEMLSGIFSANAALHPAGVLWEWTADWFGAYPGGGPDADYGEVYRVLRGGSLASHPLQRCREYRFRRCPTARSPFYGFRFALG